MSNLLPDPSSVKTGAGSVEGKRSVAAAADGGTVVAGGPASGSSGSAAAGDGRPAGSHRLRVREVARRRRHLELLIGCPCIH